MKHAKTRSKIYVLAAVLLFAVALPFAVSETAYAAATCGGVEIAIGVDCAGESNPIYGYAKGIMRFLAVLVGIIVVGAIVVGGIGYASAGDDKGKVAKSVDIIRNAIIGLLLFIGMGAILNVLIPGGVL